MKESQWTRRICKQLEDAGAVVFACVAGALQPPGWPDRWICHRQWSGWLEFKGITTQVTTLQRIKIRRLNMVTPGIAYVVRMPGRVEDADGTVLARFDGTGRDLLNALELLNEEA